MKAKILKTLRRIGIGAGIGLILIVGLVVMAMLSSLEDVDMSDAEKVAYAKGQYDAMKGDIRIEQVDSTKYKQVKSFLDDDEKFREATFVVTKK